MKTNTIAAATLVISLSISASISAKADDPCADCVTHRFYINSDGDRVHSPSKTYSGKRPAGATAHCPDGTWSFSRHPDGDWTCSHHRGVDAGG
jgi:hypothetical protein